MLELEPGHDAARYFLAALEGGTPPEAALCARGVRSPGGDVRRASDRIARLPRAEALSALARRCGAHSGSAAQDLGRGTGLMGAALHDLAGRMAGIDLSPRMIERALERGI